MTFSSTVSLDPVEIEIARNRLESISEEVGMTLIRTSYSPNIKDRRDCSAGVYGPTGELISQAEHIPLHLGLMPTLIGRAIAEYGADRLRAGDVLMTNNPYLGGSHLPDICVITPVFFDSELVALVANMAHHVDVGGMTPSSMATHSTEIFQEGIRIPPLRLMAEGNQQDEVLSIVLMNIRTADKTRGDLMAQVAANRLGERRIHELLSEWGPDGFKTSCRALLEYTDRRTRAAIAELPDGKGKFTDSLEHNGVAPDDIRIVADVSVEGDELFVDLSETDDQALGAVNCSFAVAEACVAYVVKVLADPALPSNGGLMSPITVRTRPGSLVSAEFPAPVANGNTQTAQRIVDALFGAFHSFAPGHAPAASSGSMSILTMGGQDHRTGKYFSYIETYGGGQGAMSDFDGASAIHTHMTNTRNTPCEVIEREYPLLVDEYAVARGTGGRGDFSGGDGLRRTVTLTGGAATVVAATSRVAEGPWGLEGGAPGSPARICRTLSGKTKSLEAMSMFEVSSGESVTIQTAGGGGYGSSNR